MQEDASTRRESISDERFDLDKSRSAFETKMIDTHITDFSDRIDRVDHTYETYEVKETIPNKLSRIRRELEELEDEIQEGNVGENGEDEVKKLQELFENLNRKTKEKKITVLKGLNGVSEDAQGDSKLKSNEENPQQVIDLDKRIHQLEKLIGEGVMEKSIQSMINDLFRKFKLLSNDKESLQKISTIIDEVNLKFEKSITTRRSLDHAQNEVSEDTKIIEIYDKFKKAQDFENDLPFIINRLESLNNVHLRLANSVNFTETMEQDIITISRDIENWEQSLSKLETQLITLATNFEDTKNSIKQ